MAPKVTANAAKQALILAWFHKTAVAHSIKDLEKALPQVASINGMQVKDYLQALQDDNKISVEKIGSGNWYWSFPSDERKSKATALGKAQGEFDKANAAVEGLQAKVGDAGAVRGDDRETLADTGMDRTALVIKHAHLIRELEKLRQELAAYSEQDPVEMEKKRTETHHIYAEVNKFTDQILSMEGWLKHQLGGDTDQMLHLKRAYYGDELDEEESSLREL